MYDTEWLHYVTTVRFYAQNTEVKQKGERNSAYICEIPLAALMPQVCMQHTLHPCKHETLSLSEIRVKGASIHFAHKHAPCSLFSGVS